ncbi:MAG: peptidylprolyl isomerase [Gemmatimonadota bacterium]|nr:peptidylprolyl isomerase [Gemmatimonadota bacterium]
MPSSKLTFALLAALLLAGCAPAPPVPVPVPVPSPLLNPAGAAMQQQAPDSFKVLFETTAGDFVVEVIRPWAPLGADRFYNMVRHGYFEGVRFFRVVPLFVVQFGLHGDTTVTRAWRSSTIPDDSVRTSNRRGTLTFATAGPNSRANQFFINLVDNARLDAQGFAPIGRVVGGMDVVDRFHAGYGEMPPSGRGPDQRRITMEGEPYLAAEFPLLDRIVRARLLDPNP